MSVLIIISIIAFAVICLIAVTVKKLDSCTEKSISTMTYAEMKHCEDIYKNK